MKAFLKIGMALLLASVASGSAWADRGRYHPHSSIHFGVQVGSPWLFSPYPYPPYPYWQPRIYMPPTVIVAPPPAPTIYVEQAPPPVAAVPVLEAGFWYYCQEAGAYYPHVKRCAGDWRKVPPTPAN
jgi:hypothetical protein